jgi:ubiquinone/menaquinone biosynthesis C-methylase UbiE
MGIYRKYILPGAVDATCRNASLMKQRLKIIPEASGSVLEVGIGSGLNLPFFDREKTRHLVGLDPSERIWARNRTDPRSLPFSFEFIQAPAEDIPASGNSFDTVVITYTLCTIGDFNTAMKEIRRVLKPDGHLLFCEHGRAPDRRVRTLQNLLNPFWKQISGGCHLNRDVPSIIEKNGFRIKSMETGFVHKWRPGSYHYLGKAVIC